jgi:hypothetical protein
MGGWINYDLTASLVVGLPFTNFLLVDKHTANSNPYIKIIYGQDGFFHCLTFIRNPLEPAGYF